MTLNLRRDKAVQRRIEKNNLSIFPYAPLETCEWGSLGKLWVAVSGRAAPPLKALCWLVHRYMQSQHLTLQDQTKYIL